MRKLKLSVAAMSMLLATGCQNEVIVEQGASQEYALTLDMGAQSRTMHDADGNCVWGDNEQIYVVGEGGKVYGTLTMKNRSNDGRTAVFSGKVTGDPGKLQYMVYPVPEADGTIPMGNIDGTNHNAPMTGVISGGNVQNVDYAGGLVKVPVSGSTIEVKATNQAGQTVSGGCYTFNPETGKLTFDPDSDSLISISVDPATYDYVYVPVETDASDNKEVVNVAVTTIEGKEETSQSFDIEVQQGAISTGIPSVEKDESGALVYGVETESQLRTALATGGDIQLAANIEIRDSVLVPADKKVSLNLTEYVISTSADVENSPLINYGTLKLIGGVFENGRTYGIKNNGSMTIDGTTINQTGNANEEGAIYTAQDASLTIVDATITSYTAVVRTYGDVIIENGKFVQTGHAAATPATYRYSLDCRYPGTITVYGGEFESKNGLFNVGGEIKVNGGVFENVIDSGTTRHMFYTYSTLTINDGKFYGVGNSAAGGCFFCGASSTCDIQVNGGEFTSLWDNNNVRAIFESYAEGSEINVAGGLFNTDGGIKSYVVENTNEETKAAYPYRAKTDAE